MEPIGAGNDFLNFASSSSTSLTLHSTFAMAEQVPTKRQKREEYRRGIQAQQDSTEDGSVVKMPQKKFFRQRAHANPFSDHNLD